MPELPEVETVIRVLRGETTGERGILGCKISRAELLWEKTLAMPDAASFKARVIGQTVDAITRRAKFIQIHLTTHSLVIHLRMSGDLRAADQETPLLPHDRLYLDFSGGSRLIFNDARKFGRVWLTTEPEQLFAGLGPEPLDAHFSAEEFHSLLARSRRQIKPLLMDQSFLAGVGNIYADEALHQARLHPLRNSATLTREEASRLLQGIRDVLQEGIRRNGASIDWVYKGGDFQNYFKVYQRTGEACPVCGTPIERIMVAQRGTHYCPTCQKPG